MHTHLQFSTIHIMKANYFLINAFYESLVRAQTLRTNNNRKEEYIITQSFIATFVCRVMAVKRISHSRVCLSRSLFCL